MSYLFYAAWSAPYLILILLSTVLDFVSGNRIAKAVSVKKKRLWLMASLAGNLGVLTYFKYGNFLLEGFVNLVALVGITYEPAPWNILLPVGISFGSVYKPYAFTVRFSSNQRDNWVMDHKQFQKWLSGIDQLSPAQRQEAEAVFSGGSQASASLAAIEASVGEDRPCPHCGTPGAISRGKARGLRRYQCKGCKKTFNAATGTPLAGLHRKDKWLAFGTCLADGLTVRGSAEHCGFAVTTAFRWRHRFLTAESQQPRKLTGIVEADETYVLKSRKGQRKLGTQSATPGAARPAKGGFQMSRFRCWLPLTGVARQSVPFSPCGQC